MGNRTLMKPYKSRFSEQDEDFQDSGAPRPEPKGQSGPSELDGEPDIKNISKFQDFARQRLFMDAKTEISASRAEILSDYVINLYRLLLTAEAEGEKAAVNRAMTVIDSKVVEILKKKLV